MAKKKKFKRLVAKDYVRKKQWPIPAVKLTKASIKNLKLLPEIFHCFFQELNPGEHLDMTVGYFVRDSSGLPYLVCHDDRHACLVPGDYLYIDDNGNPCVGDSVGFPMIYEEVK